uniref:Uncharacterized protein n=1 Tax=Rhizophagus irregularis (strain DAOM 181602 / DAOM 197198 / MUCL 43194) TaxID=747089 RepID=U9T8K7_RHIID
MDRRSFQLHRNEYWNNSETLIKIEWSSMFRVLKGNIELTNFTEYKLNLFKKYPIYFKDKEIYLHLWKCEYLEQVYLNMIDKFQQYLQELILVNSQMENANPDDIFKEISCYLVNLFKSYKILDKDRIRNVKLADLEHQKWINIKMKKLANKSKLVVNKLDKIVSLHWKL